MPTDRDAITYETKAVRFGTVIAVKLGRKTIGEIRNSAGGAGGFYYKPLGGGKDNVGEIMPTVAAVKRSIEGL